MSLIPESLINKILLYNIHPVAELIKKTMKDYCYNGYDEMGFNIFNFNEWGYDQKGYDKKGRNRYGYDRDGFDVNGECEDCVRPREYCRCRY